MGDPGDCLRVLRELHALAKDRDPDCPYGGFPPEALKAGRGSIAEALARGYIWQEASTGRVYLHTTGAGREFLRQLTIPWQCRLWELATGQRRTIGQWERAYGVRIIDPDGFDRRDPLLYSRRLSRSEFLAGAIGCTLEIKARNRMRERGSLRSPGQPGQA